MLRLLSICPLASSQESRTRLLPKQYIKDRGFYLPDDIYLAGRMDWKFTSSGTLEAITGSCIYSRVTPDGWIGTFRAQVLPQVSGNVTVTVKSRDRQSPS